MNDVVEFNKKSRVRSEASVWLVRLQEGLDDAQKSELAAWLGVDSMHQSEFLELAAVWDELEVLTELAPLFDGVSSKPDAAGTEFSGSARLGGSWKRISVAASFLVVCCIGGFFLASNTLDTELTPIASNSSLSKPSAPAAKTEIESLVKHYQTPIGKQLEVQLSDGSTATLNTDTRIEIGFTDQQRTITLLRGEAHFSVFKDPSRPLVVMVSGKSVEAIGTAFCVRKNTNTEIEVAVDEGRVAVYRQPASEAKAERAQAKLTASLQAGEVLTITGDQQQLAQYDLDEMADRLAWREGMIVINDETLDYVIQEFKRYSEQKVLLADRAMGEIRVAGYFRLGDVDALLVALENNFNIRSEYYQDNQTYVLSQL